jgi:hypothetical protein
VRANLDAVQLDFCNFVGNTNDFIVWTNGAAIAVADCYFKGNSGQYFVSYEAGAALEVTGCYFDQDESGSGTRWTDFGNNHFAAVFTTIAISNFETEVCPGAPSPTDSFAPSAVYNQSLPHAASNWPFEATAFFTSPEPTGQFTGRLHIHRGLGQLVKMGRFLFLVVL